VSSVTLPIPVEVEEITPGWCTEIFQPVAPGAVIRSVEVIEAHSGTTGRARVALQSDDGRVPSSVFVKLAPFTANRRAFVDAQGMGVAEARFYSELSAEVPLRTPGVWYAGRDNERRYVMVLEDLVAAHARFPRQHDPELVTFTQGVIDSLAALHAKFQGSARLATGDLEWIEVRSRGYGSAAAMVKWAVGQIGKDMPPSFHDLADFYLPNAPAIAGLLARGDRTIVHGDTHMGNMFIANGTPGLLDWAMLGCAPGMRDVAYFIGSSVPTNVRRQHERELVDRYCTGLATAGVMLTATDAWEQYRLQMITPWIAAVVTAGFGSALQPHRIAARAMNRANASIEDLAVVDLLRASLG
jgi:hypothetical protein